MSANSTSPRCSGSRCSRVGGTSRSEVEPTIPVQSPKSKVGWVAHGFSRGGRESKRSGCYGVRRCLDGPFVSPTAKGAVDLVVRSDPQCSVTPCG